MATWWACAATAPGRGRNDDSTLRRLCGEKCRKDCESQCESVSAAFNAVDQYHWNDQDNPEWALGEEEPVPRCVTMAFAPQLMKDYASPDQAGSFGKQRSVSTSSTMSRTWSYSVVPEGGGGPANRAMSVPGAPTLRQRMQPEIEEDSIAKLKAEAARQLGVDVSQVSITVAGKMSFFDPADERNAARSPAEHTRAGFALPFFSAEAAAETTSSTASMLTPRDVRTNDRSVTPRRRSRADDASFLMEQANLLAGGKVDGKLGQKLHGKATPSKSSFESLSHALTGFGSTAFGTPRSPEQLEDIPISPPPEVVGGEFWSVQSSRQTEDAAQGKHAREKTVPARSAEEEEELARRKLEEVAAKRLREEQEEEAIRLQLEREYAMRLQQEENPLWVEAERRRQIEGMEIMRQVDAQLQEERLQRDRERARWEEEAAHRRAKEEEAERERRAKEEEAERERQAELEAIRLEKEAEEQARQAREAEKKRLEEEAQKKRKQKEEAKRRAEAEAARRKREAEEEVEQKRREEEELRRREAEAEAERIRKIEEEAMRQAQREADLKRRDEEEDQRQRDRLMGRLNNDIFAPPTPLASSGGTPKATEKSKAKSPGRGKAKLGGVFRSG
eukprot:TRINITY_DN3030_c1_g1_i1.p1 TRINITY_DN3030_c1_g1~~TRINITY_DN3030_c1_g1_i1.p1  ORF type:complete len:619 (+),score=177.63 TRINITY_DN3030_c1_g1_i1:52-1908(+)